MHAEDLGRDECRDRKAVEQVAKHLPDLDGVSALDLIVEAVDAVDRRTLGLGGD